MASSSKTCALSSSQLASITNQMTTLPLLSSLFSNSLQATLTLKLAALLSLHLQLKLVFLPKCWILRKRALVDYLVQFRWIFVIFFILPLSLLYYFSIYIGDIRSECIAFKKRQKQHAEKVNKAVKRLKERNASKDGLVCTARKPWVAVGMRNVDYKRARHFEVDLSGFRNVLDVDKGRMVARVEPLVNMGQISSITVPMNLSLAVVPELDDLTVGGLINGYGLEGGSHIYGLFTDTVESYEIILADGQVVRSTKDNEYSDLFYAIPWSQVTIGLLVAAEIKLIPVKEYMKLTYKPVVGSLKEIAQASMDSFAPRDGDQDNPGKVPDFVEGLVYTPTEAVSMTGRYASKEEAKQKGNMINNVGWWFKPWFYQRAQTALKRGGICRVHSDTGLLPQARKVFVLGSETYPSVW